MASNSDSIYNVLSYIRRHKSVARAIPHATANVVSLTLPDTVRVANPDIYFPNNALHVSRMDDDFLAKHGELLDFYHEQTRHAIPNYKSVWVTTGHVPTQSAYLVELSFE